MSSIASLDAQAAARKERLAQLKSLKRKQPPTDSTSSAPTTTTDDLEGSPPPKDTSIHLSGRNYDIEARAPKMGFVSAPNEGQETLEEAARQIVETTKAMQIEETKDKPIDLFSLQPKKPNWDLKRDVEKKLEKLNDRTNIAIAKMIKARIEETKQKRIKEHTKGDETDDVEGNVAAMVEEREKEGEAERKAEGEAEHDEDSP
jgi:coiled-coil domain-containing protein 12